MSVRRDGSNGTPPWAIGQANISSGPQPGSPSGGRPEPRSERSRFHETRNNLHGFRATENEARQPPGMRVVIAAIPRHLRPRESQELLLIPANDGNLLGNAPAGGLQRGQRRQRQLGMTHKQRCRRGRARAHPLEAARKILRIPAGPDDRIAQSSSGERLARFGKSGFARKIPGTGMFQTQKHQMPVAFPQESRSRMAPDRPVIHIKRRNHHVGKRRSHNHCGK